ncbi:MAG: 16S rRNA (guanine(527)-N(7))-methyltransferase RsmG [Vampirovibrionales bacterium]|nr:16S rRNA (guanine(527)-N(7))-methyltransferase RsmG [Vampirovibrionales bacterium]
MTASPTSLTESVPDMTALQQAWAQAIPALQSVLPEKANTEALAASMEALYAMLWQGNQRMNLTRITDPTGFVWRHGVDSLTLLPFIPADAAVLDVGTGAGFPLLPLALARPDCTFVGMDSVGKKCDYVASAAKKLAISPRVTLLHGRCDELAHKPEYRHQFDVVTARGVAALNTLLELTLPFLKPGGTLLAMKSTQGAEEELKTAKHALRALHARVVEVEESTIPELAGFCVVRIQSNATCSDKYPRPQNKPRLKPL